MQYKIVLLIFFLLSSCGGVGKKSITTLEKEKFIQYAKGKNTVYFKSDSAKIEDEGIRRVNEAIFNLSLAKNIKVILYGYSDRMESPSHNKKLAEKRVAAIKKALEYSGVIKENNITVEAVVFGEYDPLASFDEADNNPKSRRVDIFIVSKER
jgi:outer membrane protein OmpA-like peptidoglycan-associated protein